MSVKVVQLLGFQGPWWRHREGTETASVAGVTALSESFLKPLVAGNQKAFVQSFSIALPIHALRGIPCLESFSAVPCVRHIEGPLTGVLLCRLAHQTLKGAPWVGSYSVVQRFRCLMGQPLYCPNANAFRWREREAIVMSLRPKCDAAVSPCFHGCLALLHRHFPP